MITVDALVPKEFGAGVVLYFMLSKSTPFVAPTAQKTIEKTMEGKARESNENPMSCVFCLGSFHFFFAKKAGRSQDVL